MTNNERAFYENKAYNFFENASDHFAEMQIANDTSDAYNIALLAFEELNEYRGLFNQGLLTTFPCRIGDVVYIRNKYCHILGLEKRELVKCVVSEFIIDKDGIYVVLDGAETWFNLPKFKAIHVSEFGENLFLSSSLMPDEQVVEDHIS